MSTGEPTSADGEARRRELETENASLRAEIDDYRRSMVELSGVADELDQVRHSPAFRLGSATLAPLIAIRRVVRAWVRSGR